MSRPQAASESVQGPVALRRFVHGEIQTLSDKFDGVIDTSQKKMGTNIGDCHDGIDKL